MKRNTLILLLISCILAFSQCSRHQTHSKEALPQDSIYTEAYLLNMHITDPQGVLLLLDTMEMRKTISQFRIDRLRATTYNNLRMYHMELLYWQKVLASDSVKASKTLELRIKSCTVVPYIETGNNQKALQIATEVAEKAHASGNKQVESYMLMEIGRIYQEQQLWKEADQYYYRAIQLLENSTEIREMAKLSYFYGQLMSSYYDRKLFDQAIQTGEKRKQLIDKMSRMDGAPDGYFDDQYGFLYSKLAAFYEANKQPQEAAAAFKKYQATAFAQNPDGRMEAIPYLIFCGRYGEAESRIPDKERYGNDSINVGYANDLNYRSEIALGRKDYQAAYTYSQRQQVILDSLTIRKDAGTTLELATIYDTNEKNLLIQQQQNTLSRQHILLISAAGLLLLVSIICRLTWRNWRITKRKNRAMAKQINELLAYKDKLQKAKEEIKKLKESEKAPATSPEAKKEEEEEGDFNREKRWFEELDSQISKEQLFLDPDISRDQLLKRVSIPKNAFAQIFQKHSGTNFSGYINEKRLDYAIRQLQDSPDFTIQAIAADSGFSNVRTFYRLFREKYGMSPIEYRNTI